MKRPERDGTLVYSTDGGRMCPQCRRPVAACACRTAAVAAAAAVPRGDGIARIALDRKGRAGKGVTVVHGLALTGPALLRLGQQLRTACGCGGTVKDAAIELQGDHRDRVEAWLRAQGWPTRRSGG